MVMPGKEYLIRFDAAKCTQCHGCETACKTWRGLPHGIQYRRVFNLWKGSYPKVKNVSLSLACLHCVQPACMDACPEEAISKRMEDGRVIVNDALCIGCGLCEEACAFGIPQIGDDGIMQKCDLCRDRRLAWTVPPCVETCPGGALALIDVSQDAKRAIEQKIVATVQGGKTPIVSATAER